MRLKKHFCLVGACYSNSFLFMRPHSSFTLILCLGQLEWRLLLFFLNRKMINRMHQSFIRLLDTVTVFCLVFLSFSHQKSMLLSPPNAIFVIETFAIMKEKGVCASFVYFTYAKPAWINIAPVKHTGIRINSLLHSCDCFYCAQKFRIYIDIV